MDDDRANLIEKIVKLREDMMHMSPPQWAGQWNELDLTMGQIKVLVYLKSQPPVRMSALAQHLGIALPSCTSLVDRLARAEMVDRQEDPSDRRLVLCALSEQGRAVITKLRRSFVLASDELLNSLTSDELPIVAQAMAIFRRAIVMIPEDARTDTPPQKATQTH